MKKLHSNFSYKLSLLFFLLLSTVYAFAQDDGATKTDATQSVSNSAASHTSTTTWYMIPWVWAIGIGVFILLLVAIARGRK